MTDVAQLRVDDRPDARWVAIEGDLDRSSCEAVAAEFRVACLDASGDVVVDLAGVEFATSQALRMVLEAFRTLRGQQRRLFLAGLRGAVRAAFATTGLLDAIPVRDA